MYILCACSFRGKITKKTIRSSLIISNVMGKKKCLSVDGYLTDSETVCTLWEVMVPKQGNSDLSFK